MLLRLIIAPPSFFHWMKFFDWWNQNIFKDNEQRLISRKGIVLFVADQDGGAHIDPGIDEVYYDLTRNHSITWYSNNGIPLEPNIALISIRQISYELIRTLEENKLVKIVYS